MAQRSAQGYDLFNPQSQEDANQNFLGYSRGIDVDTRGRSVLGTIVEGAGSIVAQTAKAVDNITQRVVRNEVTESSDMAMDVALYGEAGIPSDLNDRAQRLSRFKAAYESGKIRDSHYWAVLDHEARNLRSRWPAYREHIDNVFKDITGNIPANALRRALMEEANSGRDPNSIRNQWEAKAAAKGINVVFERNLAGNPMPLEEIKLRVSQEERRDANLRIEGQTYANAKARGEHTQEMGVNLASQDVNYTVSQALAGALDAAVPGGRDFRTFQETVAAAEQRARDQGTPFRLTPQESEQARAAFTRAKSQILERARLTLEEKYSGLSPDQPALSPESKRRVMEGVERDLKLFEDGLVNPQSGLLNLAAQRVDAILNGGSADLLASNDVIAATAVVQKTLGQQVSAAILATKPGLPRLQQSIGQYIDSKAVLGQHTSLEEAFQDARARGVAANDTAFFDSVITGRLQMLKNPEITGQAFANLATSLFGKNNENFFQNRIPQNQKLALTEKLADPDVARRIVEAAKVTDNPQLVLDYNNWLKNNLREHIVSAATEAKTFFSRNDLPVDLRFNPANISFEVVTFPERLQGRDDSANRYIYNQMVDQATTIGDRLNRALRPMSGWFRLVEKNYGRKANVEIFNTFQSMGIDLQEQSEGKLLPPEAFGRGDLGIWAASGARASSTQERGNPGYNDRLPVEEGSSDLTPEDRAANPETPPVTPRTQIRSRDEAEAYINSLPESERRRLMEDVRRGLQRKGSR